MTNTATSLNPTIVIVGAGPSGLRAAAELAPRVQGEVLVLERESEAGGIPRHSDHPGYGIRDMGKFISGPKYARTLRERATKAGARILTDATVTDWAGERSLNVTTPEGRIRVDADVVILATGARERPRPARLIPGDRGQGIYTTGHLQNIVHLKHGTVGKRAVVVGAELVSWSAVMTLKHAGCKTLLMTTEYPSPDSYFFFNIPGKIMFKTKVATRTKVVNIMGRPNVRAVELEDLDTGKRQIVECDTVILTGDWIPDNELARAAGVALDPATRGPVVDAGMRTNIAGVFAIGNALHPVDTADIAALDGAAVVTPILEHLGGANLPQKQVQLTAAGPLRWVSPSIIREHDVAPARNRLLLWSDQLIPFPKVVLRQQGAVIASKRLLWPASPGRVFRIPAGMLNSVDYARGPVSVEIQR